MGIPAIEHAFPFESIGRVATLESWRKEVNRPTYHVHKWWATRLGSVFRGILLGGLLDDCDDIWDRFFQPNDFDGKIVLDPFMGSGTTLGEALKLGCRVVGSDINPVSYFLVRQALQPVNPDTLDAAFRRLERRVTPVLKPLYTSRWEDQDAEILYTFWVKLITCPNCREDSRLFSKWIFSSNAYPKRRPEARAVCPACRMINVVRYDQTDAKCDVCGHHFDPQSGPAKRISFECEHCQQHHRIAETYRLTDQPPRHEMFALMLLLANGRKVYKVPDEDDRVLYTNACSLLRKTGVPFPPDEIPPGHNTDQARGYNYRYWHQMFNDRQLYGLGVMLREILKEPDETLRNQFLLLFSGILEFNNMFCSFKGEGTGAVRHLFHHHILKPERTPLENNPWGTAKSSGSFSTLYRRRLRAAIEYAKDPFEICPVPYNGRDKGEKVFGVNRPLAPKLAASFAEISEQKADALVLCGDSGHLPLPDASVDLVVTDPPYFDNVHYSELADFFFVWLKQALGDTCAAFRSATTRSDAEVQGTDSQDFGKALGSVFRECRRVLKPDGLLIFTFHHSRDEAWRAVCDALISSSLCVVAAHPVKAEMSVATPKSQAKEPIDLDLVIVCRCRDSRSVDTRHSLDESLRDARCLVQRFNDNGKKLSRGDLRVVLMGEFLRYATACEPNEDGMLAIEPFVQAIEDLYCRQRLPKQKSPRKPAAVQMTLSDWFDR